MAIKAWRIANPPSTVTLDGRETTRSRAPCREGEARGAGPSYTRHRAAPLVPAAAALWYRQNGRALPWRVTDDPYHILVSEMMLQQTQVDRVLPKYRSG